jgi:ribosomal protein L37AE/L43A
VTASWLEHTQHWCNECGELRYGLINIWTSVWACDFCKTEVNVNTDIDAEVGE